MWTEKHYEEEFNWMIASQETTTPTSLAATSRSSSLTTGETVPVNFLAGAIWVYYKINPSHLYDYAYKHSEPEKLLEAIVYNQFTKMVMSIDFFDIMNIKRLPLSNDLKEKVQEEIDKKELGVEIILVSLEGIHPPVDVASSFEKVVGSMEKKEASILGAQ